MKVKRDRKQKYDFKTVLQLRNEGVSYKEIGEKLGLAESTISSRFSQDMREIGMPLGNKRNNAKYDYETVKKYREEGYTYKQISELTGVPEGTISPYFVRDERLQNEEIEFIEVDEKEREEIIQETLKLDFAAVPYEPNELEKEIIRLQEENDMLRKLLKAAL